MSDDLAAGIVDLKPRLLAFARSMAGGEAEAEDLVQETYVRALGARERFAPGTNLAAWLFTILRNLHLNRCRQAAARPRLVALDALEGQDAMRARAPREVEQDVLMRAGLADVVTAFRRLPSSFAVPLHLVAVEELSYAQVATILDVPVGTVMSRIHRARRMLMELLVEERP